MDNSAQVLIHECHNCNIFIAPSRGPVLIRKCSNLKIISASGQFRCTDVTNTRASIYVNSQPALEKVSNFSLGCFFYMYTELPDLFSKAELSVWDNSWSEFNNFSQNKNSDPPGGSEIKFFNPKDDVEFINSFVEAHKDQEISLDQFFPVPFTYGMSFDGFNKSSQHMLVFFRESSVDQMKIYELLNEDMMKSLGCSLIKTSFIEGGNTGSVVIKNLENILKKNGKNEKFDYLQGNGNGNGNGFNNKSGGNNGNENYNEGVIKKVNTSSNINCGFVMLWMVSNCYSNSSPNNIAEGNVIIDGKKNEDGFNQFINVIEDQFENCMYITDEDIGSMEDFIKKIYTNFKL
jgi:hypothetical protein